MHSLTKSSVILTCFSSLLILGCAYMDHPCMSRLGKKAFGARCMSVMSRQLFTATAGHDDAKHGDQKQ
jgi:hypothetical protein